MDRGEKLRGVTIFNVPVGEDEYIRHVLRDKAEKVKKTTKDYTRDMEEETPTNCGLCCNFLCNIG